VSVTYPGIATGLAASRNQGNTFFCEETRSADFSLKYSRWPVLPLQRATPSYRAVRRWKVADSQPKVNPAWCSFEASSMEGSHSESGKCCFAQAGPRGQSFFDHCKLIARGVKNPIGDDKRSRLGGTSFRHDTKYLYSPCLRISLFSKSDSALQDNRRAYYTNKPFHNIRPEACTMHTDDHQDESLWFCQACCLVICTRRSLLVACVDATVWSCLGHSTTQP
jgi:hypothetical protein